MRLNLKKWNTIEMRFILVGMLNTVIGTSIMFIAYNVFHLDYWIASALNYSLASLMSYHLHKRITFKIHQAGVMVFIRFNIWIAICYLISFHLAKSMIKFLFMAQTETIQVNSAFVVGTGLFILLNYLGQKYWVFVTKTPN